MFFCEIMCIFVYRSKNTLIQYFMITPFIKYFIAPILLFTAAVFLLIYFDISSVYINMICFAGHLLLISILLVLLSLPMVSKNRIWIKTQNMRIFPGIPFIFSGLGYFYIALAKSNADDILFGWLNWKYIQSISFILIGIVYLFVHIIIRKTGWYSFDFGLKHGDIKHFSIENGEIKIETEAKKYVYQSFKINDKTKALMMEKLKEFNENQNEKNF